MTIRNKIMASLIEQYIANTKFRSEFKKSFFPSVLTQLKDIRRL